MHSDTPLHVLELPPSRSRSLRGPLMWLTVTLAVAPVVLCGVVLGHLGHQEIRNEALAHVSALAAARADIIEGLATGWRQNLADFADQPRVRQAIAALASREDPHGEYRSWLESQLGAYFATGGGRGGQVAIVGLNDGRLLAWTGYPTEAAAAAMAREYSLASLAVRRQPWLSDPHGLEEHGMPVVDAVQTVWRPTAPASERPVAAVLWIIGLANHVYPYIEEHGELGDSGEIVLVDRNGVVLKDLRHLANAVLRLRIMAEPAQRALTGEPGAVIAKDYRGVLVMAGYHRVAATGWGVVAKIDAKEAYAGLRHWSLVWVGITMLALLVSLLIGSYAAHRVARPIMTMAEASQLVAEGDMSTRLSTNRGDEIGSVANVFNEMVSKVAATQEVLAKELERERLDLAKTTEQLQAQAAERRRLEEDLKQADDHLHKLSVRLSATAESERRQVAAELHDTVVQYLGFIKMRLQLLDGESGDQAKQTLADIQSGIQEAIDASRMIINDVSPPALYQGGLVAAVRQLSTQYAKRHRLTVTVHDDQQLDVPNDIIRILVFNCIRELLTNVVKHAETDQAEVIFAREGNEAVVTVADPGRGLPEQPQTPTSGGFGLFSIRERLREVGGTITMEPNEPRGLRVTLRAPLDVAQPGDEAHFA